MPPTPRNRGCRPQPGPGTATCQSKLTAGHGVCRHRAINRVHPSPGVTPDEKRAAHRGPSSPVVGCSTWNHVVARADGHTTLDWADDDARHRSWEHLSIEMECAGEHCCSGPRVTSSPLSHRGRRDRSGSDAPGVVRGVAVVRRAWLVAQHVDMPLRAVRIGDSRAPWSRPFHVKHARLSRSVAFHGSRARPKGPSCGLVARLRDHTEARVDNSQTIARQATGKSLTPSCDRDLMSSQRRLPLLAHHEHGAACRIRSGGLVGTARPGAQDHGQEAFRGTMDTVQGDRCGG